MFWCNDEKHEKIGKNASYHSTSLLSELISQFVFGDRVCMDLLADWFGGDIGKIGSVIHSVAFAIS
jgi:hypothetical protein